MLAIRERNQEWHFFEYTSQDNVKDSVIAAYEELTQMDELEQFANIAEIMRHMSHHFIDELFERQIEVGDVMFFACRDECIEALNDSEKMEEIMISMLDQLSYNDSFSDGGQSELEFDYRKDIENILRSHQLQYITTASGGITHSDMEDAYGNRLSVVDCVLQEVW